MTTVQIRIDDKTKRDAKRVLDSLGMDLSGAVKIYFRQISRMHGIPFPLVTSNGFTKNQEQQLILESNATLKAYKSGKMKGYTSTKKLMADLLK